MVQQALDVKWIEQSGITSGYRASLNAGEEIIGEPSLFLHQVEKTAQSGQAPGVGRPRKTLLPVQEELRRLGSQRTQRLSANLCQQWRKILGITFAGAPRER